MTAEPIVPFIPAGRDADWEQTRARMMEYLASHANTEWTDHNVSDPGVTLAEAAAFGIADGHYRVERASYAQWPLASAGTYVDSDRHWHATLPAPDSLPALAVALAAAGDELEPLIRDCESRAEADALLLSAPWTVIIASTYRTTVIALMRGRHVRRLALECADIIADAVAAEDAASDTVAARDARAALRLEASLPAWPEECAALVRRERRRRSRELAEGSASAIWAVATEAERTGVRDSLAEGGLTASEADMATWAPPRPIAANPEDLEDAAGSTRVWPPHPIQSLTCEPVTASDYARRARTHASVVRAWAVRGRLDGVAWHGLPTPAAGAFPASDPRHRWEVDPAARALTLVVERRPVEDEEPLTPADQQEFLREVLASAVGFEVRAPFPNLRDDLGDIEPRRGIADEVGAALLRKVPVFVVATLVVTAAVDRTALVRAAEQRIDAFFAQGRPESRPLAQEEDAIDGPWPPSPQPRAGWNPGEAIRLTEIVEQLVADSDVLGVKDLVLRLPSPATPVDDPSGALELPADAVPVRAPGVCLTLELATDGRCADA